MDKHQPIHEGSVTVSLIDGDTGIRTKVDAPSSPGIFSPVLQPKNTGTQQLVFDITTPQYTDKIVIDNVMVYASMEAAKNAVGSAREVASISFL